MNYYEIDESQTEKVPQVGDYCYDLPLNKDSKLVKIGDSLFRADWFHYAIVHLDDQNFIRYRHANQIKFI